MNRFQKSPNRSTQRAWVVLFVAVLTCMLCDVAGATFQTMSDRLPGSSNAIVAVNVAKLLQTPYAKSEEWAQTAADAWAKSPMLIPPGSTRVLVAAEVPSSTMDPYWQLSLIEMENIPSLQSLAAAEGGYLDRVWDKDAVCSPINAYFIPLDAHLMASITPAERSTIAKWLRTPVKSGGNVTSDYIKGVLADLGEKTDIVMAMDLEGAFGVVRIRNWLDNQQFKEIPSNMMEPTVGVLGTMQGITLTVQVNTDATGRAIVTFTKDAGVLRESAKPIMIAVLNTAGMHLDDVDNWKFTTIGKQVIMEGPLSTPSLRKLLSVVQSPVPAATVAAPAPGQPSMAADAADPAKASQRYYRAVCACLDSFKPGTSTGSSAAWVRNAATRIEQLPILHVDPELVNWGAMVSTKLRQVGAMMVTTQTQIDARVAGVMNPDYRGYSSDGSDTAGTSYLPDPQIENAKRQRRQAAQEQRAQAQEQAIQILNEIAETRPKIRASMVEKYKVEF